MKITKDAKIPEEIKVNQTVKKMSKENIKMLSV